MLSRTSRLQREREPGPDVENDEPLECIVVVDDIVTTGTTMLELAATLPHRSVVGVVLADALH